MYLKPLSAPHAAIAWHRNLPSGAPIPPRDTCRWTARRKADVVTAVTSGLLTVDEVLRRYQLSLEEFTGWCRALDREGIAGLRVSHAQRNRNAARQELVTH